MYETRYQRRHAGAPLVFVVTLLLMNASVLAESAAEPAAITVYRSVNADGVVSFSDSPHASATAVEVIPPPPADARALRQAAQLFEQQLALLEILEAGRQARAADELEQQRMDLDYVRTEAALERARLLAEQRENTYYPVFSYPYGYGYGPRPTHPIAGQPPHRPPHSGAPEHPPKQYVRLP